MELKTVKIFSLYFVVFLRLNGSEINDSELALHNFMQGEFLMNQGNYALAILEFQEAIELDPNASTIHVSIADGYRRLGKVKRAENHLQIALDLDPEEKEAREMLGQLYLTQKKYKAANNVYISLNSLQVCLVVCLGDGKTGTN